MESIDTGNEQGNKLTKGNGRTANPNKSERLYVAKPIRVNDMKVLNRVRILYAEDDEDACVMLSTLLGFSDIDVLLARSIKEAFQAAQNEYFDVYLLDSRFPDGNGFELCRQLREFNPQTPIVFYSGDAYENDKQKALTAGANVYLVKPDSDTVAATIFRLVTKTSDMR